MGASALTLRLSAAALCLGTLVALTASSLPTPRYAGDRPLPFVSRPSESLVGLSPLVDAAVRHELVQAQLPLERALAVEQTGLTDELARTERRAGLFNELVDEFEAARSAYLRAIELGDDESWRDYGRVSERVGDWNSAEAAYLGALSLPYTHSDRVLQGELHRDLGELYLHLGWPVAAGLALEKAAQHLPDSARVAQSLMQARLPAAQGIGVGAGPGRDWGVATTPVRDPRRAAPSEMEPASSPDLGLESLRAILPEEIGEASDSWLSDVPGRDQWPLMLGVAAVLVAVLIVRRRIRRRGDLAVTIEYPEELRGTFNVRLNRGRNRREASKRLGRAAVLKGGTSSPFEHHSVSRETLFPRLSVGSATVTVEGILRTPDGEDILADCFEHKELRILTWRAVRAQFEVHPAAAPVEVVVRWDDEPAREATVAVWGRPETLDSARGAPLRLNLRKGAHRLAVGSGDRVMLVDVEVESFLPTRVVVDIARSQDVAFKGCPPAVEPYMLGDVQAASRALERDGQAKRAQLLLAVWHRDAGRADEAAAHFEAAGRFLEAAELRASLSDTTRAAELYMAAREPMIAARLFRSAGQLPRAGEAYEAARDFANAIECYRESGEVVKWIEALERQGQTFEAAQTALESGERGRGIRLLQRVGADESHYSRACVLLADAYEQEGHWDLAAQKLEEYIALCGPGATGPDLYARLAGLFEQAGYIERALEMLEDLRRREPTHPNLAARIELLRKQRSSNRMADSRNGISPDGSATALMAERRYEILREIGRGGMGIVYQARDKRLGRVVALKQLPEKLVQEHPKTVQRFLQEAQAAAKLNHPNIVTVYDSDREDGIFFITMEMLMGEALNVILRREGRLPENKVVQLALQICSGLEYAHRQGIIHRDIKTANLFVTSDDVLKIMDFGLAKMLEQVRSASTILGGTPFYMSPEQVLGEAIDPRSDLYSFGVTLYELATGQVPFYEGEVAYHHCHTEPVDPRRRVSDVSDAFAELVLQLLEKDPERRLASALDVGKVLESLLRE